MTKWALAPGAEQDLIDIYVYGGETFGPISALDYIDSLTDCFALIADQPRMGRAVATAHRTGRRFEHRRHVIYYEERAPGILILAVVHERSIRDIDG